VAVFLVIFMFVILASKHAVCSVGSTVNEDEIGPYWVPLGLVLRLKPDGKVEATDVHDDVSLWPRHIH